MRSSLALVTIFALALAACGNKEKPAASTDGASASGADATASAGAGAGGPAGSPATPGEKAVDGEANITSPLNVTAGANITVTWTGPGNGGDYIDVVARGETKAENELSYAYVKNSNGSVSVRAPTTPGDYDVRYVLDLNGAKKIKVAAPLVVGVAAATLKAPPTAEGGQDLQVEWTGPNGPGDYVDVVKAGTKETSGEITYAYTSAGSPAKIEAPGAGGDYEIRYVLEGPGGRKVTANSLLKVSTPKASLDAPGRVTKGQTFKVTWKGPRSSGDYVDLVRKGQTATSGELDYFYVKEGNSGELTAKDPGDYEIRYVLEAPGGRSVLAKRAVSVR